MTQSLPNWPNEFVESLIELKILNLSNFVRNFAKNFVINFVISFVKNFVRNFVIYFVKNFFINFVKSFIKNFVQTSLDENPFQFRSVWWKEIKSKNDNSIDSVTCEIVRDLEPPFIGHLFIN